MTFGADGNATGCLITNVAIDIRVNDILSGHIPEAGGIAEVRPVFGLVEKNYGLEDSAGFGGCRPMKGHRIVVVEAFRFAVVIKLIVVDDGAEMGFADGNGGGFFAITIMNDFVMGGHITPSTIPLILKRVGGVDFEHIEVLRIRPDVGYTPSDTGVVADDYTGGGWQCKACDFEGAGIPYRLTVQTDFIPD